METKFNVGDRVRCDGLEGSVIEIKGTALGPQYVVDFDGDVETIYADCPAPYTMEAVR